MASYICHIHVFMRYRTNESASDVLRRSLEVTEDDPINRPRYFLLVEFRLASNASLLYLASIRPIV